MLWKMVNSLFEKDIFGFQVAVYESSLLEHSKGVKQLRHEDLDKLSAQTLELVLLDQFVEVRGQELKDKTQVVLVQE